MKVYLCEERDSKNHKWKVLLDHGVFLSRDEALSKYWNTSPEFFRAKLYLIKAVPSMKGKT